MTEDVYEPLPRYRDEFKEKFSRLAHEKFASLTEKSAVDITANRELVAEIKDLQSRADSTNGWKMFFGALVVIGFVVAAAAAAYAFAVRGEDRETAVCCVMAAVGGLVFGAAMILPCMKMSKLLESLRAEIAEKKDAAWEQMAPLNALYTWDVTTKLIEETVPRLVFDPYFTAERLSSLHSRFGMDDNFNEGKSMLFAQTGEINGNPFVFGQYIEMEWGSKTYVGTKSISWTEWERGSDGKRRLVRKYETLYAHVTKPIPEYNERKVLIYGNDVAPDLSFSRQPSGLSGDDSGMFDKMKKMWRLNRLKAYSRNLDDESQFTLMANHEFETWFHAKDRDNEVDFRLMFTPIAQMQMLALMKDDSVGYGDDFAFIKRGRLNLLMSDHLDSAVIDTDPERFRSWDYDAASAGFVRFNEKYFKDIYFSLAPLLSIPAYQQVRTGESIRDGGEMESAASSWELETIANYYGERTFQHPDCITHSLLKTRVSKRNGGESVVSVTAHGYCGVERVTYVSVHGGDGKWHDVAVNWTEYLPVKHTRSMRVAVTPSPSEDFMQRADAAEKSAFRRSVWSFIG